MKKELLLIFEMFHLIIKLPSGEYYVPGMIHSLSENRYKRCKRCKLPPMIQHAISCNSAFISASSGHSCTIILNGGPHFNNNMYDCKQKIQEIQLKINQFISEESFRFIGRKYKFSPRIPFGFIERLIVRILHFPGMEIHPSSSVNNFYVFSEEDGNYNNRNFHSIG